jgi:hypothetical protein
MDIFTVSRGKEGKYEKKQQTIFNENYYSNKFIKIIILV